MAAGRKPVEIGLYYSGIFACLRPLPESLFFASCLGGLELHDAGLFPGMQFHAAGDQHPRDIAISRQCDNTKLVGFRAIGSQHSGDVDVSHDGGKIKRGAAFLFRGIDVRAMGDQQFGNIQMPGKGGKMKGGGAIPVAGIDIGAIGQLAGGFFHVAGYCRRQERIIGSRKQVGHENAGGQR